MTVKTPPVVVAITGASGAIYAIRLMQMLCVADTPIHLTISPSGAAVIEQETGLRPNLKQLDIVELLEFLPQWASERSTRLVQETNWSDCVEKHVVYHRHDNFMTPIASGSFLARSMVICPCSGSTLSGVAISASNNLIQRAAEVHY